MKKILLPILILSACHQPNRAIDVVLALEPDAKCTSLYVAAGPNVTSSALCRLPNKQQVICTLDTANGFTCPPWVIHPSQPQEAAKQPEAAKQSEAKQPEAGSGSGSGK